MNRTLSIAMAFAGLAAAVSPAQAQTGGIAQTEIQAARAQCMALPADAERLACLNAALDRLETASGLQEPASAAPPAAPPVAPSAAPPAPEMGAEQLAARQPDRSPSAPERETLQAAIVAAQEPVPGRMVLELDNGQVWRQIDGDARGLYFASGATPVEIRRSRLGGYRMTLLDQRQMLRVERIR